MKRRDVIKGVAATAGVLSLHPRLFGSGDDAENTSFATPIRGLARKQGALQQPVQLKVEGSASGATCITRFDGRQVDSRNLSPGPNTFSVYLPPVQSPRQVQVECEIAGKTISTNVRIEPVRKLQIFILPHSHHDLGYTDLQANVEEKQMANISRGIELARNTAANPLGARFVWNLEVLWGADQFMRRKSPTERGELIAAVKKGWIALNGMYANELTGLCRPEELLQLFRYAGELGKQCGVRVNSAMISDVPGYSWGTVTAMAQAGIRYFSAAPNYFDRIGTFMVAWQDKPFWWVSPSGKEKVLLWVPWTGYAMSHIMKLTPDWVNKYQARLDEVAFPYEISHIRWSGHGDNAEPDPEICDFVKAWNEEYEWPRFTISSVSDAFSAFERQYGDKLPQHKGDLTPYWEDGAGSSARETSMSRMAAERITQATTLAAMLAPAAYNPATFNEAWRNVLLYSEHTWGAWNSVSDSENPFVAQQWKVKQEFAVNADTESRKLLQDVLLAYGSSDESVVDVHNTCSWPRSGIVIVSKEASAGKDHVKIAGGVSVPSQRLSTGELAFLAEDVSSLGTARFRLSASEPHAGAAKASIQNSVLDNGLLRVGIDRQTGNIVELVRAGGTENLVDVSQGEALNQYLFLEGSDTSKLATSGPIQITVEEPGPLVATLRIESPAPGCNRLVRRVCLKAAADWVEISNTIDKKRAPLNPHPGQGGPGEEFAQHQSKESAQFAFPFAIPGGQLRVDAPLSVMRPEIDQLPGSCKNWLTVGRWADVSNAKLGATWATLDAPLIEAGSVSATMLGSQKKPEIWRKYIEPTQKFYSWVINNHWGTNYRAYQDGLIEFRYAIRPHDAFDPAAAGRFAIGLSQPFITSPAGKAASSALTLRVEPADILVYECKPANDGKDWLVRLFGSSDENRTATVSWAHNVPIKMFRSNLNEEKLELLGSQLEVAAWDLVTLRIESPHS
jgi:alpha-mannosidase